MTTPIVRHAEASEVIGSWPLIPPLGALGAPGIIRPGTVLNSATILGMKRETSSGFSVVGAQFDVFVDNEATPASTTVGPLTDPGPGYLTLDEVVTQINAVVTGLASNDNGFLRLTSSTSGDGSYLRLETNSLSPVALQTLGLFPGLVSRAGQLAPAGHPDPVRSASMPGQLLLAEGESFSARAINRAIFQIAINSDRTEGLISRKRIATQEKATALYSTPASGEGYQLPGGVMMYTGRVEDWAGAAPTQDELEKLVVILDADNRELVKENISVITSDTTDATFSIDTQTGKQRVYSPDLGFIAADATGDRYVLIAVGVGQGVPPALIDVPLKITEVIDVENAVVAPIDPLTGDNLPFAAPSIAADKVEVEVVRCWVEGIYDTAGGNRIEDQNVTKFGPTVPSRVEKNNRVVFSGESLSLLSFSISVGDAVEWAGHLVTDPWSNNGTFRVKEIIDDETIELMGMDGEPVYLNSDLTTASPGTVTVTTDAQFYESPFLKFRDPPDGAIPGVGDTINIFYMGAKYLRDALDDPAVLTPGGVQYQQELDDTVQRTILAIIGPSVETMDDYLHNDRRNSLEDLDYRVNHEHYSHDEVHPDHEQSGLDRFPDAVHAGRHRDIRPDSIDMFSYIPGITLTIRADPLDPNSAVKAVLLDRAGTNVWNLYTDGHVRIRDIDEPVGAHTDYAATNVSIYSHIATLEPSLTLTHEAMASAASTDLTLISWANSALISAEAASSGTSNGIPSAALKLTGSGTDSIAYIDLKGKSNYSALTPASGGGATFIQMEGDTGVANSPFFSLSLIPGSTPPLVGFDWLNDGAGNTLTGMRMGSNGAIGIGPGLQAPVATVPLTVYGTSGSYPIGGSGSTSHPQVLALGFDGATGYQWGPTSNDLNSAGVEAAFLSAFPYNDSGSNDDRTWSAFKHMFGATLVERFKVNKYGQLLCNLDSSNTNALLVALDPDLRDDVGAWVRGHLLVGNLGNWDKFAPGDDFSGTQLWLMGGSSMAATAGPFGITQAAIGENRYAMLYNCWPDETADAWRYITDQDYAIRIRCTGNTPGVGVWGHTDWAAAAPSTVAGATISTIAANTNWVHALYWDHETGYIGLGTEGTVPTEQLHIRNNQAGSSSPAIILLQMLGDSKAGMSIYTASEVNDPFLHLAASSANNVKLGIDYSTLYFRMQPGLLRDANFNSVAASPGFYMQMAAGVYDGNCSINTPPSNDYDLLLGAQGFVGALLAGGLIETSATSVDSIKTAGGIDAEGQIEAVGIIHTSSGAISTDIGNIYTTSGNIYTTLGSIYTTAGDITTTSGDIKAVDGDLEVQHADHAFIATNKQGYRYKDVTDFECTYGPCSWVEGPLGNDYDTGTGTIANFGTLSDGHQKYERNYIGWAWSRNISVDGTANLVTKNGGSASMNFTWPNMGAGLTGFAQDYSATTYLDKLDVDGYKYANSGAQGEYVTRIRVRLLSRLYNNFNWTLVKNYVSSTGIGSLSWNTNWSALGWAAEDTVFALVVHAEGWSVGNVWKGAREGGQFINDTKMFQIDGVKATFKTSAVMPGGSF